MNPNFVKKIDYWIGVPLCFFVSFLAKIERVFAGKKITSPKGILFLELSEVGSAILAYSAMEKAKEFYPDSRLYFCIFKDNAESLSVLEIIPKENVIVIRSNNFFFLFADTIKSLFRFQRERIDTVIDLELFSRFSSLLAYFSRAKFRIGFYRFSLEGLRRADVYTHKVLYNPYLHISKNFLAMVYSLKSSKKEVPFLKLPFDKEKTRVPKVNVSRREEKDIWVRLKKQNQNISLGCKIIVLNLGLGEDLALRRWPLQNYLDLAKELLKDKDVFILLAGIKAKKGQLAKVKPFLTSGRCLDFMGKTTIKELLALFNFSRLLISHDSGIINLASLAPVNTIILFGPETPLLYAPLNPNKKIFYKNFSCSPCFSAYNHRSSPCDNNLCLKAITVDEVLAAAREYL